VKNAFVSIAQLKRYLPMLTHIESVYGNRRIELRGTFNHTEANVHQFADYYANKYEPRFLKERKEYEQDIRPRLLERLQKLVEFVGDQEGTVDIEELLRPSQGPSQPDEKDILVSVSIPVIGARRVARVFDTAYADVPPKDRLKTILVDLRNWAEDTGEFFAQVCEESYLDFATQPEKV
jgi:hypothetical protein